MTSWAWKSPLGWKRSLTPEHQKILAALLDKNYYLLFRDEKIWLTLHKIDQSLDIDKNTAPCIYVEKFSRDSNHTHRDGFKDGETTLVIRLISKEVAQDASGLLNHLMSGSGVHFAVEEATMEGRPVYRLRTNMNKPQWSRLAVCCKYRFNCEISGNERDTLHHHCQEVVNDYLGTYHKDQGITWFATEGMPAWVALAGMHGILRPEKIQKPDRVRKLHEINGKGLDGIPHMFRDVPIHVDINKDGTFERGPYFMGHDPFRAALGRAMGDGDGGHSLVEIIFEYINEATGLDSILRHISPTARGLHGGVLLSSVQALMEGRLEPVNLLLYATGGALIGFVGEQWKLIGHVDAVRADPAILTAFMQNNGLDPATVKVQRSENNAEYERVRAHAFSHDNAPDIETLLRDAGVFQRTTAEVPGTQLDKLLTTKLATGISGLFK